MELKDIKVGSVVVCNERHNYEVLWGSRCEPLVGKPMKVQDFDSRGYIHCRGVEHDDSVVPTVWRVEWLEAYEEKGNRKVKKAKKATGENTIVDETMVYGIREIISNPKKRATTVCFNDGRIICVKAGVDVERPDIYSAVTAAIGIHFAGSNNALKNIISRKTTELKPKRKGPRKEFTIDVGDLVKLTKRGKKEAAFPAGAHDGENHPHLKVSIEDTDREMLVAKVEDGVVYANVPERIKDYDYKIPVGLLRITRKGE